MEFESSKVMICRCSRDKGAASEVREFCGDDEKYKIASMLENAVKLCTKIQVDVKQ